MSPRHVIAFDADAVPARDIVTDDPAVVDVPFVAQSRRHFTQVEKGAFSGIWEAPPHRERVDCDYDEMCHLLEGRVRLTDAAGQAREFGPGESFVVARGFKGTWENLTHVRKVFFILS
ncbi:cupin domain-containing protein [Ancylobacter sp. SL191]|uniref:cupin domain-containing protein n=1 Tax=Ancylobacter sp. SL191 TaxID=2995166 RepID=UPI002272210E|nr:cupin domain-containing protein [Ancylobacter sp. SL191]WAC26607.1 cupin domain-containing protein [Ancylobacter sp. SL191]